MAENHHSAWKPPTGRWTGRLAAPLILALLIVGFYWKLVFTSEYTWLEGGDIANQVLPWFQMQAGEWHAGRMPLWDPYHWLGQPLLGQAQPGAAYPLNWLLFLMPLRDGWMKQFYLHWYFVLIHVLAGLFAYLLARSMGRSRSASLFGGLVFALAAYVGTIDWPQMLNGAIWAPLVFLFLLRALDGKLPLASGSLGGFFLGIAWLSGHHQVPIYISMAAAGVWIYGLWAKPDRRLEILGAAGLFWTAALMAGALQILPAMEYARHSVRWVGLADPIGWQTKVPYHIQQEYSLTPSSLLGVVIPGVWTHADPFLGLTVVLVSVLGVLVFWHERPVRTLAVVAGAGLVYAMGGFTVMHGLLYSLMPVADKARNPAMAVVLWGLGGSMLAAAGADGLRSETGKSWLPRLGRVALALAALLFTLKLWQSAFGGGMIEERRLLPMWSGLLLAAVFAAISKSRCSARAGVSMCCLLFLFEVSGVNMVFSRSKFDTTRQSFLKAHTEDADLAGFLKKQPGLVRVDVDEGLIPFNFGDWHGISQTGGYLASITDNFMHQELHGDPGKKLLGVRYSIQREATPLFPDLVYEGRSGRKIFGRKDTLGRAFVVHSVERLPGRNHIGGWMNNTGDAIGTRSFLLNEDPPALATCSQHDNATVTRYTPNEVQVTVTAGCRGMLILSDTYYPGWRAKIDGQAQKIYEAYGLLRGVVVEAGTHEILFQYRPSTVLWGGTLSAASLPLCLLVFWRERRRSISTP